MNQLRAVKAEAPTSRPASSSARTRQPRTISTIAHRDRHISRTRSKSLSGHSTRTAVITSRIPIAAVAQLHHIAQHQDTTVSALIARIVADKLNATKQTAAPTAERELHSTPT